MPKNKKKYVCKPVFGREGNSVRILEQDGNVLAQSDWNEYLEQPMLYQECIDIPLVEYNMTDGKHIGHAIVTCFIVNNQPTAIGMRVNDGLITNAWSHYLPLGIK